MDFVAQLIQEGNTEQEIGDILECLYQVEKNGDSQYLSEELLLIESPALRKTLEKLRKIPQTPWVKKQIARIEKLLKSGKDKVDDVSKKVDDGGAIVKKADDAITVSPTEPPKVKTTPAPKVKATPAPAPKVKATTPTGKVDTAARRQSAKDRLKAKKTPPVTPLPLKPKGKGLPKWVKPVGLAGLGALGYSALTGDDMNIFGPKGTDTAAGTSVDSGSNGTAGTSSGSGTQGPKSTTKKDRIPKAPFWWSKLKPKTLGYQMEPSTSSYRNVRRRNEAYEIVLNHLIDGGHAETIEEANYIMMQMEFDHFVEIVEGADNQNPGV